MCLQKRKKNSTMKPKRRCSPMIYAAIGHHFSETPPIHAQKRMSVRPLSRSKPEPQPPCAGARTKTNTISAPSTSGCRWLRHRQQNSRKSVIVFLFTFFLLCSTQILLIESLSHSFLSSASSLMSSSTISRHFRSSSSSFPSEPSKPLARLSLVPSSSSFPSTSSNSSRLCPAWSKGTNGSKNSSETQLYRPNPCVCYGSESAGIFVECRSASLQEVNATLSHLSAFGDGLRTVTIYKLNTTASQVHSLPPRIFERLNGLTEIHISSTNLTELGTESTYSGLEESLTTLSFVNSLLSYIPKSSIGRLRGLQTLDLQSNRIASLDSYAFYGLPLRILNLQGNRLENLHEFAFGGLENSLEELSLISNKLANFPLVSLRRLRKLHTLKLQSNLIVQIPDDGFTRLTVLETLDLASNQIRHLTSRSFVTMPKLRTLYASNNQLSVVSDSSIFASLQQLETLDLSLNRLRVVNLDGLESIRTLDLSNNHLHDLRLHGLTGLRELFASHNNILRLMNETFANTEGVEVLYLQHNAIHSLLYNALHGLKQLRVLDLSWNQIRELHSSLFKFNSKLESLYLDNNLITDSGLEAGIFQELIELRDLRLQHNMLKNIRKVVFYSLPNLQELDLQMNQIESIESLESLSSLQHLNLQGNRLQTFSGTILSSFPASLRYLQLSNNRISSLQNDTFKGQTEVEVIWLNNNHLKSIDTNIFSDLINLEKLYLDHNQISNIADGSFGALKNLQYLSLDNNQLNHLNTETFYGLDRLRELYLSNCEIIGIEQNVMQNMSELKILDLSNNQIYGIKRNILDGLSQIEELYLSNIMSEDVEPDAFVTFSKLRILDLSLNSVNARKMNSLRLPNSIQTLNISHNNLSNDKGVELSKEFIKQIRINLLTLDLSNTHFRLDESAQFLSILSSIEYLYLDGNEIQTINSDSFPKDIKSLKYLSFNDNRLDNVPNSDYLYSFVPNLEHLILSRNQIKQITIGSFKNFNKLKYLNLAHNRISVIESHSFAGLNHLVSLDLTGNVLRSLTSGVFNGLDNIETLIFNHNWLQFIPQSLLKSHSLGLSLKSLELNNNPLIRLREDHNVDGNFERLQTLSAQNCNLTSVSSHDLVGFTSLNKLLLSNNHIQTISPSSFRSLINLVELDLSQNKLDNLPEERLSGLNNLERLNLSLNSLTELPRFNSDLVELKIIDISFNKISRIDNFGALAGSVTELSLKHNMISFISNNAFVNMTSLVRLDLRQNFLTQISDSIFEAIELRLEYIHLSGNPFHCDCRLLSIYEWLEQHSRAVILDDEEEMVCDQPEKLKHQSIQSLMPIDFCPIPMLTTFEFAKIEPNSMNVQWEVQNETLVGGFTLEYYLTSERSLTSPAGLQLNSLARSAELRDLIPEKWYTVCVEANGKYLQNTNSGLEHQNKPQTAFMLDQKQGLQDFVTSNRKCSQVRTLSQIDSRKLIALPATTIIIALGVFAMLISSICVLAFILVRFRRKRRSTSAIDPADNQPPPRSATIVSFGGVTTKEVGELELEQIEPMLEPIEEYVTYKHYALPTLCSDGYTLDHHHNHHLDSDSTATTITTTTGSGPHHHHHPHAHHHPFPTAYIVTTAPPSVGTPTDTPHVGLY